MPAAAPPRKSGPAAVDHSTMDHSKHGAAPAPKKVGDHGGHTGHEGHEPPNRE